MSGELVLVTGASGFLGSWVCKKLQEQGYRVRGTVRSLANKNRVDFLYSLCEDPKHPIELVEADLLKEDGWKETVKDCKYVMHTASPFFLKNPTNPDEMIKPAVDGTLVVLRAASEAGTVAKVVVTSSFAAVEDCVKTEGPHTEEDWSNPDNQSNVYMRSKTLAEKAAWDFVKDLPDDKKFTLSVINPVVILGPVLSANPAESVDRFCTVMDGKVAMIPQVHFTFIDVRDTAEAHVKCITTPEAAGKRFLVAGELKDYPSLVKLVADEFNPQGYKIPTTAMPNLMLRFVSLFNSDVRNLLNMGGVPKPVSNENMKTVLGVEPTPLQKTVVDMGYSLIEQGRVRKTPEDKGPPSGSTED